MPYLVLALGIVNLALVAFQVATGLRWIRFRGLLHLRVHQWAGIALLVVVVLHAVLAVDTFFVRVF